MINLNGKEDCICKDIGSIPEECINSYTFKDDNKSIQLKPKNGEKVTLIAIDKCVIDGNDRKKCDCFFIFEKSHSKTYTFLVELKGKNYIENAFNQLSLTRGYDEYNNIISQLSNPSQRFVIVSDVQPNRIRIQKLEKQYNIRVSQFLFSEPQSPIPDLRKKLT